MLAEEKYSHEQTPVAPIPRRETSKELQGHTGGVLNVTLRNLVHYSHWFLRMLQNEQIIILERLPNLLLVSKCVGGNEGKGL